MSPLSQISFTLLLTHSNKAFKIFNLIENCTKHHKFSRNNLQCLHSSSNTPPSLFSFQLSLKIFTSIFSRANYFLVILAHF